MPTTASYVHVEISGEFHQHQKVVIGIYWALSLLLIFRSTKNNNRQGWVALACAVGMVQLRHFLTFWDTYRSPSKHPRAAPAFDLAHTLPVEPIVFLLAVQVISWNIQTYGHSFMTRIRDRISGTHKEGMFQTIVSPICLAACVAMICTYQETWKILRHVPPPQEERNDAAPNRNNEKKVVFSDSVLAAGCCLGSMLSVHGNLHNFLIVFCYAYDDITAGRFFLDIIFPGLSMLLVVVTAFVVYDVYGRHHEEDPSKYSGIPEETEGDDGIEMSAGEHGGDVDELCLDVGNGDGATLEQRLTDEVAGSILDCDCHPLHLAMAIFATGCLWPVYLASGLIGAAIVIALTTVFGGYWIAGRAYSPPPNGNAGSHHDPILAGIDAGPILLYIGLTILTASLTDTGLQQYLLWCGPDTYNCENLNLYLALSVVLNGIFLSPLVTTIMVASMFPYLPPFEWFQVSLELSTALLIRAVWRVLVEYHYVTRRLGHLVVAFVATLVVALFAGFVARCILQEYHGAYECSFRLGECV